MEQFLLIINYLAIIYFFSSNTTYIILNFMAFFSLRRLWFEAEMTDFNKSFKSEFYKPLSIIVPAYNEQETIIDNIRAILALQYPEFEIIVVNDGSKDDTAKRILKEFNFISSDRSYKADIETEEVAGLYHSEDYPNLVFIDKKNGGKADALNAGINIAQYPLVCNIDADSLISSQALLRMTEVFVTDYRVVAAGGTIRVANDCEIKRGEVINVNLPKKFFPRIQVVEYLRAFLFGRMGWTVLDSLLIISGAFGIFRRKYLTEVGGYRTDTVGEDMELILRLNRELKRQDRDYKVTFLPDPVCWTQVPDTAKDLGQQRRRWQQGLAESLFMNWELFANPKYGLLGIVAVPFFFFIEFLGPVFELLGYISIALSIILGIASKEFILLFLTASILLAILLSTVSVLFEQLTFRKYDKLEDIILLFSYGILENFGYRQLHSWWRLQGIINFIRGKKSWGEQSRKSFSQDES